MKTFINNKKEEYLFVEVPDDSLTFNKSYRDSASFQGYVIQLNLTAFSDNHIKIKQFKDFEIISTTKDITEEQFENIHEFYLKDTENGDELYYDFVLNGYILDSNFRSSIISLLKSLTLNINKNYLILQKI